MVTRGEGRRRIDRVWGGHVHTAVFKMDNQHIYYCITQGTLFSIT